MRLLGKRSLRRESVLDRIEDGHVEEPSPLGRWGDQRFKGRRESTGLLHTVVAESIFTSRVYSGPRAYSFSYEC